MESWFKKWFCACFTKKNCHLAQGWPRWSISAAPTLSTSLWSQNPLLVVECRHVWAVVFMFLSACFCVRRRLGAFLHSVRRTICQTAVLPFGLCWRLPVYIEQWSLQTAGSATPTPRVFRFEACGVCGLCGWSLRQPKFVTPHNSKFSQLSDDSVCVLGCYGHTF